MWTIKIDDLTGAEIAALLTQHVQALSQQSPPESCHVLDLNALRHPDVTFWSARDKAELLGCGALKKLSADHAELKSMRTVTRHLRKGVARALLRHILEEASQRGYQRISLETGSQAYFQPAQQLYASAGFVVCPPFADYIEDPLSTFMTKQL